MAHGTTGVRNRHRKGYASTRGSHGGGFDPTATNLPLYGSEVDTEGITANDYLGSTDGAQITPGSIGQQHLAEMAVTAAALAENAVQLQHMADGSVGYDNILPGAVRTDHLYAGAVTSEKIYAGAVTAEKITADGLSANVITSGTLRVGGLPTATNPDYIDVFNEVGGFVMRLGVTGLLLVDPGNPDKAMRLREGVLQFSDNFSLGEDICTWSTAISAAGITADSIRVGVAPGGHNLIPNSSFEVAPYVTGQTHYWPTDQAWGTALADTTKVNVATGGAALELTVVA